MAWHIGMGTERLSMTFETYEEVTIEIEIETKIELKRKIEIEKEIKKNLQPTTFYLTMLDTVVL